MGGYNGRLVIDGDTWWLASYDGIAKSLGGSSADAVRRHLTRRLEPDKELLWCQPRISAGDRPRRTACPLTCHYAISPVKSTRHYAHSGQGVWPNSGVGLANLGGGSGEVAVPIRNEELVEPVEPVEARPPSQIAPSSQFTMDVTRGLFAHPHPNRPRWSGTLLGAPGQAPGRDRQLPAMRRLRLGPGLRSPRVSAPTCGWKWKTHGETPSGAAQIATAGREPILRCGGSGPALSAVWDAHTASRSPFAGVSAPSAAGRPTTVA